MSKIFVSGLINQEVNVKVDKFPIEYSPVSYSFFGINTLISGVGFNVAKSLSTLGNEVSFMSVIGNDNISNNVLKELEDIDISDQYILRNLETTPESVILVDNDGIRSIHCDLKSINHAKVDYQVFKKAAYDCDILCLCNINYNRHFLNIAKDMNKIIATDVHVLSNIDDKYNNDFLYAANILFLSNEGIKDNLEEFVDEIIKKYDNDIIVVGCGSLGAYMYVKKDKYKGYFTAVKTRYIVNTIGAGDALFSSFIHVYNQSHDPYLAIKKANIFASYKIGENGASKGFLTNDELEDLYNKIYVQNQN